LKIYQKAIGLNFKCHISLSDILCQGVDYREEANNLNAIILSIDLSKDNRFVEIIGTQMIS
jgi:hypothetical protein